MMTALQLEAEITTIGEPGMTVKPLAGAGSQRRDQGDRKELG